MEIRLMQAIQTSPADSPTCRELRKKIQAIRIKRLNWSEYVFKYVMEGLGYGRSLRALDEAKLQELFHLISTYRKPRQEAFNYDQAGKYMYHLQRSAGWSDLFLRQFITLTYSKTHWNLLTPQERSSLINILKENIKNQGKEN